MQWCDLRVWSQFIAVLVLNVNEEFSAASEVQSVMHFACHHASVPQYSDILSILLIYFRSCNPSNCGLDFGFGIVVLVLTGLGLETLLLLPTLPG